MSDYLQRYLPEYDDEGERLKLAGFTNDELKNLLIQAYKERRVLAKKLGEFPRKEARVREVLDAPSELENMPDVPGPDDLKKLME